MAVELIVTDPEWVDRTAILDYDLDLAYGADENSFELVCREGPQLAEGCLAYADGTEYGGVVDTVAVDTETDTVTYSGRTWHGIIAGKVLVPDAGKGYLTVSGSATAALSSLIARMGLSSLFAAEEARAGAAQLVGTYQFARFVDGYSGIVAMLKASGLKLAMRRDAGKVVLRAEPIAVYGDDIDSDRIDFSIERTYRPVNHLVCAGEGELENRAVVHFYADEGGSVSHTQTLFGVDERAALYQYNNADADKLEEEGRKKLSELQGQGEVKITVDDEGTEYDVGDVVTGWHARTGEQVTAEIAKKVLKVDGGTPSLSYECGSPGSSSTTGSLSGTAESSASRAYTAGKGVTITNYRIDADVDSADLAAVRSRAEEAAKAASDAQAQAAGAFLAAHPVGFVVEASSDPTEHGGTWRSLGNGKWERTA